MRKNNSILTFVAISFFAFWSCNDQEYYQTNPNAPSTTTPGLLLTNICIDVFNIDPVGPAYASRHLTYYERPTLTVNYGWTTKEFSEYSTLRQVKTMQDIAVTRGDKNYQGLAKFFRAVLFARLTETFGDVPYSQALKGSEGIFDPEYDTQEDIYVGLLKELDEANDLLKSSNGTIDGDIIYGGNANQWKKAVNAFKLRLLIHLSKKEDNAKLNIKQQFKQIVDDAAKYPLMIDNKDNAQIVFNETATDNYYPTFNNLSFKSLVSIEKGIADRMKATQDPRLFSFADPISGTTANNFNNYDGVDAGLEISDQQNLAPKASKIHKRFTASKVNEPMILIGYSEQEFLIAEALSRGWINGPGSASSHYNNAIRASMQFHGVNLPTTEAYINKPGVKFDATKYLEMIITQKHISMFMQAGWEPFFEQRRTGFPHFNVGLATLNDGKVPKRWRYPQDEFDNNKANLQAAIQSQYGGVDDVNGVMWLLK